ncbi:hypothetical protein FSY75_10600 [Streptomyces sp. TR1341]|nr:hypothetical protein [Streptomyces sp. TR1341]
MRSAEMARQASRRPPAAVRRRWPAAHRKCPAPSGSSAPWNSKPRLAATTDSGMNLGIPYPRDRSNAARATRIEVLSRHL